MRTAVYGPYVNQESTTIPSVSLTSPIENAYISSAAPGATITFDTLTSTFQYYTTATTANFTFNIRGNSTTTLNATLGINQSLSLVLMITNGSTGYYPTAFQIDGTSVTPKWLNGITPSAGGTSGIDSYSLTIIKTANSTYTVIASGPSKFA
jgi:hypothetical protein